MYRSKSLEPEFGDGMGHGRSHGRGNEIKGRKIIANIYKSRLFASVHDGERFCLDFATGYALISLVLSELIGTNTCITPDLTYVLN